jgi:hypothetical protein
MSKLTQECYRKIFHEMIQALKEDTVLRKNYNQEMVQFIE